MSEQDVVTHAVDADAVDAARAAKAIPDDGSTDDPKVKAEAEAKAAAASKPEGDDATQASDDTDDGTKPEVDADDDKVADADEDGSHFLGSLFDEWEEKGELTEASSEKAKETIFNPKLSAAMQTQLLGEFVDGLSARKGMSVLGAYGEVGGKDTFDAMMVWAKDALSEEDIKAHDIAVSKVNLRSSAIKGLHARYVTSTGDGAVLETDLSHDSGEGAGTPAIASRQELAAIQSTKRYKTDPAYRDSIDAQVGRAMKSGRYVTS